MDCAILRYVVIGLGLNMDWSVFSLPGGTGGSRRAEGASSVEKSQDEEVSGEALHNPSTYWFCKLFFL